MLLAQVYIWIKEKKKTGFSRRWLFPSRRPRLLRHCHRERNRTRHRRAEPGMTKKNMAVGRHRAPANIRSELVVIGALFTTDSHHRLPLRIFFSSFIIIHFFILEKENCLD